MKSKIIVFITAILTCVIKTKTVFSAGEGNSIDELLSSELIGTETVNIIVLMLVLGLLPSILVMMTSFTRVLIIMSFTRSALGTQQMPPNTILIGISLFLTFFIMSPVIGEIDEVAYTPYINKEIEFTEAVKKAEGPLKEFMFEQVKTEPDCLNLFLSMTDIENAPEKLEDIPLNILVPAFITSELGKAFKIGFLLFIPFIMIDMIVASILMSMGMMMLPPAMISLPFKILLFVMVDGWELVMKTIIKSFF